MWLRCCCGWWWCALSLCWIYIRVADSARRAATTVPLEIVLRCVLITNHKWLLSAGWCTNWCLFLERPFLWARAFIHTRHPFASRASSWYAGLLWWCIAQNGHGKIKIYTRSAIKPTTNALGAIAKGVFLYFYIKSLCHSFSAGKSYMIYKYYNFHRVVIEY